MSSSSLNLADISKRRRERIEKSREKRLAEDVVVVESKSWSKTIKYYYDRFRYYHFYVADKVETSIAVVSLWIIKLYFFLMGYGPGIVNTKTAIDEED